MPDAFLPESERFLALPDEHSDPATAGALVIPAPFEHSSSYGQGSAAGPAAILEASAQVEFFDAQLGFEPYDAARGIATLAPVEGSGLDGAAYAAKLEETVARWIARDRFVAVLGGEHSAIVGSIWAHAAAHSDLTIVQIDAHSDLRTSYQDNPWSHACAMARALDRPCRLVQVGIRSEDITERRDAERRGAPVFYAHAIHDAADAGEDWIAQVVNACTGSVYITFDLDAFDPAVMPATGTPEPGGLRWRQVIRLLARLCVMRRVVGADFCELAPIANLHHPQFTAAKLVHWLIGKQAASR